MSSSVTGVPSIGFIDSGVGGLTIYKAVRAAVPWATYHYCADNAHFPYGTRDEKTVISCVTTAVESLQKAASLDLLVVACNTASTIVLPPLRQKFSFPIVGVVPAIKPAAKATRTGTIGLLATPRTISGPYTDELIGLYAGGLRVVRIGSANLARWAEAKLRGEPLDEAALREELAPFFAHREPMSERLDVAVLGCTHFPLLLDELMRASDWPLTWLDSASAIAARVATLLATRRPADPTATGEAVAWFTRGGADVNALKPALMHYGLSSVRVLKPPTVVSF